MHRQLQSPPSFLREQKKKLKLLMYLWVYDSKGDAHFTETGYARSII